MRLPAEPVDGREKLHKTCKDQIKGGHLMANVHRAGSWRFIAAAAAFTVSTAGAVLVGGVTTAAPVGAATTGAPQHYLCYTAAAKKGFTPPAPITLVNAFTTGNGVSVKLGPASEHCNPAVKKVPGAAYKITNPTWHFLGFPFQTDQPSVTVSVSNQFGTATLVTSSPNLLLVPSWKSLTGPPKEPTSAPAGEDHYTCYPVTYLPGTAPYTPPSPVKVKDEFSSAATTVKVENVDDLCAPTTKILPTGLSYPPSDPSLYYVCFGVSKTPIKSPVYDQNQFGEGAVTIRATNWLCLPSSLASTTS